MADNDNTGDEPQGAKIIHLAQVRADISLDGLVACLRDLADALERDRPGPFGKAVVVLYSDKECAGQHPNAIATWPFRLNCTYSDAVLALGAAKLAYELKIMARRTDTDPPS